MTAEVRQLAKEALSLSNEARIELVEVILQESNPSTEQLSQQMSVIRERMQRVEQGQSELTPAKEAHSSVRQALADMS